MPLPATITDLAGMMDHFRVRVDDFEDHDFDGNGFEVDDTNLLWRNSEVALYANQAVREVAIRSRVIKDNSLTAGLTTFAIASTDDGWVSLSDLWLSITRVSWTNDTSGDIQRLDRVMERRLDREIADWQDKAGEHPCLFVLNEASRDMRVYPLPEVDGTLRIEGARQPVTEMAVNDDTPEIPAHYLHGAINWMCYLAYLKNDADTKDPKQAASYEAAFTEQFGPRPDARTIECNLHQAQSHRPRTYNR